MMLRLTQFVSAFDFKTVTFIDYTPAAPAYQKRKLYRKLQELGKVEEIREKRPEAVADMEQAMKKERRRSA